MLRSDPRIHYKMYKAKKNMVYAALFSFAVLGGLSLNQNAKADTVENANATPTVQTAAVTSQSTATPQSTAADVNTANSAPTAQPVAAQPVSNNQTNSASNVASQTPTTTLNIQPVHPAQNFAATRQASLYAQSLVQVPAQNEAQNVQAQVKFVSDSDSMPDNTYSESNPNSLRTWVRMNVDGSFDIDASQLKKGNSIPIFTITQHPEIIDHIYSVEPTPIKLNGVSIGVLRTLPTGDNTLLFDLFVTADDLNYIGTQHIAFNNAQLAAVHRNIDYSLLKGHQSTYTDYVLNGNGLSHTFRINYKAQDHPAYLPSTGTTPIISGNGFTSTGKAGFSVVSLNPAFDNSQNYDNESQFISSNANQGTINDSGDKIWGIHLYQPKNNTWMPSENADLENRYPFVQKDGQITDSYGFDSAVTTSSLPEIDAGADKSFNDLLQMNQTGLLYSQQRDGSYVFCYRIPRAQLKIDKDNFTQQLNKSYVYNIMDPSNEAYNKTLDVEQNKFKMMPVYSYNTISGYMADPTVKSTLHIEVFNEDGRNLIKPLESNLDTMASSSMAHGQAAVKLHVINAQNGTELNQVQNFVDWPNQGKKANLSLPNIRGYQVVSDASAASAALQKLGLKGNVVTQAEAVDYPAADNTTNYYIVMDPVTETATVHFIDQDSGNKELSHVDLTGAYNTPITANGQVTNMLNNYVNNQGYELVSNDLAGNHLYTDAHQDFNIVLKHKTQKRNPDNDPSDATKDITRTINVHNPDGSVKTTTQTAHLTREGVQDEATKQTTWGAWSTGNWAEFDTPAVQDYTPSQAKVNAQTVDSNTQDQTIDITYKANILNKDVDFVVPEVIHRTDQHGQTTIDRTQNVTLHGTVTYNAATSQLVGFDLHSADFPAYDIPQIDGYTSHVQEDHIVSLIPGDTNFDKDAFLKDPSGYFNQIMKGRQGGLDHVIDAKTIPQTTAMQYKDGSVDRSYDFYITYTADPQSAQVIYYDTILKKNVKTDTLNGKTDETVNTNIQVPANYVLVPGQNLPTTYTFKGSNNQNIIVNLTHATKDTTTTDPDAHKTVTRTIIVNTPHDGTKTTKQDVQLTRSATLDLVTNTTTYGNWNTGTWAQYDTPAVPGYTPTQASVPQVTVTGDTQDTTVTVNYTANPHVQVIEYVGDGKVQHTQNVNGVTDQTVNGITPEVPTNWVLAPGAKVPTSVTFGPNDPQTIIVNIVHDTKDVTKTDAGAHKTITRTIHVNDPHNGTSTTNQVVNLTRPAWFDMVTNDIHYGEWNTGNWAEFDSPAVAGYTVNPAKVAAQTVTSDTKDTIVNVDYTANPQQVVLNFVDKAGNVIATHLYKGVTDGTAKIDAQVPTNWVLVPGQTIPTSYTFKASDNKDINIVIEHGTKDTSKTDKNAVRDVTRIINLHDPHKGTTTTKQVAHLHRSATLDLVTNQTTYGKWDTDATNWKEFDVPTVDGYTPNMNKVAATTVDENIKDQTIDVTYTANPQQVVLNFVDKAGNVIASHTYKGVTDGTAKIDAQVPENWVLVKGQTIPTDYTFKAENNKDIDILIEHGMQDVSKTDEKANKDITRTIIVTNPDGKKTTTNQVAHLNRSAIKDLVTGEVTYGQWNTGKWDAFDTPEIAGYDASIHHLDGQNVDINDEDETINIHYNALTHTQDINYVDDNGDVVGTQVVTGQTGETAGFTPDVPNGYTIVPGQDIPKSFTFGANDPKTLVIHVTKPGNNSQTPASDQPASNEPASQTPAQSESGSNAAPASDNSVVPSAPASANTNAGTETSYAAPATAAPVATAAPIAQTSGNDNAGQGTLPQTGDNSISAIAGLSLAGMTGAILAAGALKRRHN